MSNAVYADVTVLRKYTITGATLRFTVNRSYVEGVSPEDFVVYDHTGDR